jgi:hypothetical protein
MFHSLCVRALRLRNRLALFCLTVAALVIGTAHGLYAQTAGSSFPDLAEPVDVTEVCTKVVAFLAICVGAVLAIKLGMAVLTGIMGWFGVKRRGVV